VDNAMWLPRDKAGCTFDTDQFLESRRQKASIARKARPGSTSRGPKACRLRCRAIRPRTTDLLTVIDDRNARGW